jgi:hypothetical protein
VHRKSFRRRETGEWPRRSDHIRGAAPPPTPPRHETPSTRAGGEPSQSLPDFAWRFLRSIHWRARRHLFQATAAPSAPLPGPPRQQNSQNSHKPLTHGIPPHNQRKFYSLWDEYRLLRLSFFLTYLKEFDTILPGKECEVLECGGLTPLFRFLGCCFGTQIGRAPGYLWDGSRCGLTRLESTLPRSPRSVHSKGLTRHLNPLKSTLTETRGRAVGAKYSPISSAR